MPTDSCFEGNFFSDLHVWENDGRYRGKSHKKYRRWMV